MQSKSLYVHFSLIAFCICSQTVQAIEGSSFEDLRKFTYERPYSIDLPLHPGLKTWDVIRNLIGSEDRPTHGLSIRSRRIFVDERDIRDTNEPKWLHPRGACAEARWIISEENAANGLFTKGVNIPALVRISSGDGSSEFPTKGRIFGMALKLFPTKSTSQKVKTANAIFLDQYGFERSSRKYVFHNDKPEPIYFTNVAPAKSALGKFLSRFFDRFDIPNFARPLSAISGAKMEGVEETGATPYEIRLVSSEDNPTPLDTYSDFRSELQQKRRRVLNIMLQSMDGKIALAQKIGRIEIGDFVVSDFCDLGLHFFHNPIQDQWTKYRDYEVVKDLPQPIR